VAPRSGSACAPPHPRPGQALPKHFRPGSPMQSEAQPARRLRSGRGGASRRVARVPAPAISGGEPAGPYGPAAASHTGPVEPTRSARASPAAPLSAPQSPPGARPSRRPVSGGNGCGPCSRTRTGSAARSRCNASRRRRSCGPLPRKVPLNRRGNQIPNLGHDLLSGHVHDSLPRLALRDWRSRHSGRRSGR
jgi:hypothetical protein